MNTSREINAFTIKHFNPQRLMDPVYFKNLQRSSESRNGPTFRHQTNQLNQSEDVNNVVGKIDYMRNPNFGQRNFACLCDSSLIDRSSFHRSQKFGARIRLQKLQPLVSVRKPIVKEVITKPKQLQFDIGNRLLPSDINDADKKKIGVDEQLRKQHPQDERTIEKRIIHPSGAGPIFLFKSFAISEQNSENEQQKSQQCREVKLCFTDMMHLISLAKLEDILHFLQNNLEILDHDHLQIRYATILGIPRIENSNIDLPKKLFIENKSGSGFYLIEFPIVELHIPEHSFTQKITLNTQEIFEFMDKDFLTAPSYLERLDQSKLAQHLEQQRIQSIERGEQDTIPIKNHNLSKESEQTSHQINQPVHHPQTMEDTKKEYLQIIVVQAQGNQEDNGYHKKVLKQVVEHDNKKFIVTFCPTRIDIREKKSDKLIKTYFLSCQEFVLILEYSQNNQLNLFCENFIGVETQTDEMEMNIQQIKKKMEIKVNWPNMEMSEDSEVGQQNISNGLFEMQTKVVIINNIHFLVQLCPPTLVMYDSDDLDIHPKKVTTKLINELNKTKYNCNFQII